MKRLKTKLIALCLAAIATSAEFAQAQNLIWAKQYDSQNYTNSLD
jgi:hypothetical protein